MDYQTITDQNSDQWEIQQQAYTDESGLRKVDDMYCVAVGSYYADECGVELLVQLDDGTEFKVIVSDLKQDAHTDETNRFTPLEIDGKSVINEDNTPMINVIEFIVDTDLLPESAIIAGDVSELGFEGNIISIKEIIYEHDESTNSA